MTAAERFLDQSREFLSREYLPKIRACMDHLSEEDIWWRPNEASNAVGNLVLHLAGNIRQWIVAGVGGTSDARDRAAEFAERGSVPGAGALAVLEEAMRDADRVLAGLAEADLLDERTIQGRRVNVLEAVYHVVEHCAMHTGQIAWITKLRTGRGLAFYEDAGGLAVPSWPGARPMRRPPEA